MAWAADLIGHQWDAIFLLIASPFVGSFLGLLAHRLPEHEDVVFKRSHCRACGKPLEILELIPIFSYLRQRGKCRACGAPIPFTYPLIEVGAVLITLSALYFTQSWILLATCGLGWALLAAAAADLRVFILPNVITLPLIPAGLAVIYFAAPNEFLAHVLGAAAGGASLYLLDLAYRSARGRAGLGMGDVKLLAGAGAWLGWTYLPWVVLIACVLGLAGVLVLKFSGRSINGTTPLPFGAPLAASFFALWIHFAAQLS